jgi:glycosyltransferase involved in cell wall biosynthesis
VQTERVLIAPRGELARSALVVNSAKKRLAGALLRTLGLPRNVIWHATSAHEVADIKRFMRGRHVDVVEQPSTGPIPAPDIGLSPDGGVLRLIQVGRIVPIKNLLLTLRALALVKAPVALRIVGSIENPGYWRQCETVLQSLPSNVTVSRDGHLTSEDVRLALVDSDAMILPTRGENFGHAIAESLAIGCPVLIPPTTMWTDMVRQGAGRLIDVDSPELVATALEAQANMTPEERAHQRHVALRLYSDWWLRCDRAGHSIFGLVGQSFQPR